MLDTLFGRGDKGVHNTNPFKNDLYMNYKQYLKGPTRDLGAK